jgi:murein DD-endopeptidase MepM/ murein hydrolase activator NlpD
MITVLQRQHVRKRAVSPVRMRARSTGVRWQQAEISVPVGPPRSAGAGHVGPAPRARSTPAHHHRFLAPARILRRPAARQSLVERITGKRLERAQLSAQLAAQKPRLQRGRDRVRRPQASAPAGAAPRRRLLQSAWIAAALGAVLAGLVLVPALRSAASLLPGGRPRLPDPADTGDALYLAVVPEEPVRPATASRPPSVAGVQVASYTVKKGDSLSLVAQRHRLSLGTVISWNDIRDGRSLTPGTVLDLPNADGLKYRVRRGDTLEGIARSMGVSLNDILDWNGLSSAVITVGQVLFLPGVRLSQSDINRVTGSLFIYPVRGRLSSTFGSRSDPFTGVVRFHNGVDLVARLGTSVGAAMSGTVAAIGFNANYGRYVFLQHPGYQTMYAHLNRIVVSTGQRIAQGQKIGELGNTGYSTGPHLHFSIYRGAEPVDPLRLLK